MFKGFNKLVAMMLCTVGLGGIVHAQEVSNQAKDTSVQDVLACRSLVSNSERLACLDQALHALERAFPIEKLSTQEQLELAVRVEEQTQKAAEKVFGQTIKQQESILSEGAAKKQSVSKVEQKNELKQIASRVANVEMTPVNKAIVYLDNGQVWKQLEADDYVLRVKPSIGKHAIVKKKMLGGYTLRIGNKRAFRVTRVK